MRILAVLLLIAPMALGLGLYSANEALERGFGFQSVRSGSWSAWLKATAPNADPYTRAHFSRTGELPPPPLESLVFIATSDSAGDPIRGTCRYRLTGRFPPSRAWTLTLYDADGQLIANAADRYSFTSAAILRDASAPDTVVLAAEPSAGNWLPLKPDATHEVRLVLYDTPLATEAFLADTTLPEIVNDGCTS